MKQEATIATDRRHGAPGEGARIVSEWRPRIEGLQQHILVVQPSFVDLHLKHTHTLTQCLTNWSEEPLSQRSSHHKGTSSLTSGTSTIPGASQPNFYSHHSIYPRSRRPNAIPKSYTFSFLSSLSPSLRRPHRQSHQLLYLISSRLSSLKLQA